MKMYLLLSITDYLLGAIMKSPCLLKDMRFKDVHNDTVKFR